MKSRFLPRQADIASLAQLPKASNRPSIYLSSASIRVHLCSCVVKNNVYNPPMPPRGFSLVELLVVIGIIAVLVGILVPSLSKARQQAERAACLSNLRQVHQSVVLYANAHKDVVPLGYRDVLPLGGTNDPKQFSSMIYSGTAQRLVLFGNLIDLGYFRQPQTLFCPSEADARSQYASPQNPFPPGSAQTINTAAGYAFRPEFAIPDDPALWNQVPLPRLSKFKRAALLADLLTVPARVETRHRTGANVLYADGSAKYIPRSQFNTPLSQITSVAPSSAFDPQQDAIWKALDR
jgi:prepilin-type N-terminal cleavage/methylation domain-containing protein/prepilin-type processing-associated H-X9-DG protein